MTDDFLVSLEQAEVARAGRSVLFVEHFIIRPGEHWAVLGGNGAGKSTLFALLSGELWPLRAGSHPPPRLFGFKPPPSTAPLSARERIRRVSSEDQERYQRMGWRITALEAVLAGFFDAPLLYQQRPTPAQEEQALAALELMNAAHLQERLLPTLSQGELRRVLVARALAPLAALDGEPGLLLLDEVCDGLDPESRGRLLDGLGRIACGRESPRYAGVQLAVATHRLEELPPGMTHAAFLEQGRIAKQGCIQDILPPSSPPRCPAEIRIPEALGEVLAGYAPLHEADDVILELRGVDVYREGRPTLQNIDFTFRQGEQWGVVGPNGAGKSTFLELVAGLLHPSCVRGPAGDVERRFNQEHLAGLRTRIGLVSPRLQATWPYDVSAGELVVSGLDARIGLHGMTPDKAQRKLARQWLRAAGLEDAAERPVSQLSNGQRRRAFLARAMLAGQGRGPALLLLDEPCSGLDAASRRSFLDMLGALAEAGVPLLLATHHEDELIPAITHLLRLEKGRIVQSGPRSGA